MATASVGYIAERIRMLGLVQTLIKPVFGSFEREELKKFGRMGMIFAIIIGSYWTLRVLKNAVFCTLIGAGYLGGAKIASVCFLVPLLMLYTKMLDKMTRAKVFYVLSAVYGFIFLGLGALLTHEHFTEASCKVASTNGEFGHLATAALAYTFYLAVESYGSLIPALFWAIASETTMPDSAKKGFSFVVALGQLGGIVGPFFIAGLPERLGFATNGASLMVCGFMSSLVAMFFMYRFFNSTPAHLMVSFTGHNQNKVEHEQEPGFFEGLSLLIRHKYLLGIFAVVAFPEFITAVIDMHFNSLASQTYTGTALANYLGWYGSSVNFFALLFLLCGVSNITRVWGVSFSLLCMPILYALSLFGFITLNSLTFLFFLMASSKAINYALNVPAIKQLYIPTSHDARFKAQAWIESFGSRGSKATSGTFNTLLVPMQKTLGEAAGRVRHAMVFSYVGFSVVAVWFFIAFFLGRKYNKAVEEKNVIC